MACEIGVAKEMDKEEEIFRLPYASQMTSLLCPRVWRGVGTARRCRGKGFKLSRLMFRRQPGFLQGLCHFFLFFGFFLCSSSFLRLRPLYRPLKSFFVFVRARSAFRSFVSVCLTLLLVLDRHCHFTHENLPSADDSVQSNLEISKLLVSSVQHPG